MSEPSKNIPAAFRNQWSVQPLSYVYYLILWGVPNQRTYSILKDLLPGRGQAGITSMIFKVRQYITMSRSGESKPKWMQKSFIKRMDQVVKMPISSNIARFKDEGKGFAPTVPHNRRVNPLSTNLPNPVDNDILIGTPDEPESPFKHQKLVRPLLDVEAIKANPPGIHRLEVTDAKLASEEDHRKFVAAQKASEILPSYEDSRNIMNEPDNRIILDSAPSVLQEVKDLVTFARGLGATEVEYKDVKIKF